MFFSGYGDDNVTAYDDKGSLDTCDRNGRDKEDKNNDRNKSIRNDNGNDNANDDNGGYDMILLMVIIMIATTMIKIIMMMVITLIILTIAMKITKRIMNFNDSGDHDATKIIK